MAAELREPETLLAAAYLETARETPVGVEIVAECYELVAVDGCHVVYATPAFGEPRRAQKAVSFSRETIEGSWRRWTGCPVGPRAFGRPA